MIGCPVYFVVFVIIYERGELLMSIVVHTVVRDGIVVCADTRTTITNPDKSVRYDDTAEKIVPFPNNLVVTHCGDGLVRDSFSVMKFLYDLRAQIGEKATIATLPLQLLTAYIGADGTRDTTFRISGLLGGLNTGMTYMVSTKNRNINLLTEFGSYGSSYGGVTNVVHSIMNSGIDYKHLSLSEAIALTQISVHTSIDVFKYHSEQVIGGNCQTYVIDCLHDKCGWAQSDGAIIPDSDAPSDALEQLQKKELERYLKKSRAERAKKKE